MIKKETGMKQMKNRKVMLGIIFLTAICGCRSVGTHESILKEQISGLDKLGNVMVITREDGSGTRNTFSQLTGFDEKNKETGASDLTRTDAETADSASLVLETIAQEKNAIGYVSMGALDDAQGVKVLQIDGKTLNAETVQKGTYPLSRSFYIAYYENDNELEQEFLRFIRGKGQETVEKQYVAVGKASTFVSLRPKGTIMVDGSTSIAPLMEVIAEEYMLQNPEAEIVIEESDSSKGIDSVIKRNAEIAMSSRELKDYEKELLDYETIAKEGIAVVVNEENPLETITLEQLRKIYTGEIDSWKQLNE